MKPQIFIIAAKAVKNKAINTGRKSIAWIEDSNATIGEINVEKKIIVNSGLSPFRRDNSGMKKNINHSEMAMRLWRMSAIAKYQRCWPVMTFTSNLSYINRIGRFA